METDGGTPSGEEPFWGGHPHFRQAGLDKAFQSFLLRSGDALDILDVDLSDPEQFTITARREPDRRRPDHLPKGHLWFPDIWERKALVPFEDLDVDGEMGSTVSAFVKGIPYRIDARNRSGSMPTLKLRRHGISLKLPTAAGMLGIYVEGREKNPGSKASYWMCASTLHVTAVPDTASDLMRAGGHVRHALRLLHGDARCRFHGKPEPSRIRRETGAPFSLEFPLDAFVTEGLRI